MKFKSGTRRKAIEYEKDLIQYWKNNKTFEKSIANRPAENSYVFYDGPPFITGEPHHGTLLSSIVKDAVPRFWTMQGKRVERRWGWDCHGLPAEVFTEKKLGIQDRRDIGTKISLEEYITTCRDNMITTGDLWEDTIDRVGRWVNFKGAYKTMDKEFMESVWWAFKELYEKGKIYEGERVLMYCTRDATPLAKAEIAMDNSYKMDTDPSVYVKFKLANDNRYLLAWTTTPWTLPSNSAIAVNQDLTYAEVEVSGEVFIIAKDLLEKVLTDEKHQPVEYKVVRELPGNELVGLRYEQPFGLELDGDKAFRVWHADFVHAEDGTGIAHESPAYGEEDYALSREHGIPWVMSTDENGFFTMGEWMGQNVWEVNKEIAKTLHERGIVWKIDYIRHQYPHCYRCDTKLMYRAHPSWFMDIDGQRTEMLEQNSNVNWFPEHLKHGRFEKTVQSAPDWNLSRDRFWATAMPVWKGVDKDGVEHTKVIGSYAELKELSGVELDDYHRPWIDDVTFELDGIHYTRIEKVMDCWFESGAMPFAQFHYPFENVEQFEQSYPGDFIVEYVGQVRAWFYYVHAIGVALFGTNSYKNVITTGSLAGNDGRKMSKSFGNYTDPNELMDQFSADALRLTLLSSPVLAGEDFALLDKDVNDTNRKLAMIWNMYDFFTMYAEVDKWEFKSDTAGGLPIDPTADLSNSLDLWAVSRVHEVLRDVETHMKAYDLPSATRPLYELIEDMSNWYVRRSRRRFWKSDDDSDKQDAYRTLHYVLTQMSIVFAPFTPFLSEELYRNLTGNESVHLLDWPAVGHCNDLLLRDMKYVRQAITAGLALRAQAGIKVRQPLSEVKLRSSFDSILDQEMKAIIAEELNVKQVSVDKKSVDAEKSFEDNWREGNFAQTEIILLNTELSDDLRREGYMREIVRHVQSTRKGEGLQVDDRIELTLHTEDTELASAIKEHTAIIKSETLASSLHTTKADGQTVKVDGKSLVIALKKA